MMTGRRAICLVTGLLFLLMMGVTAGIVAQDDAEARIASAVSAAPSSVSDEATVIDIGADGLVVLREGTNGWTCIPDSPATPGPDPMCLDEQWMIWLNAYLVGEDPEITAPGMAYMLAGGSDASNDDPFATEPAEGEEWLTTPPHVMVIFPDGVDISSLASEHGSPGPWVMFAGTPYAHVMFPVADTMMDMAGN